MDPETVCHADAGPQSLAWNSFGDFGDGPLSPLMATMFRGAVESLSPAPKFLWGDLAALFWPCLPRPLKLLSFTEFPPQPEGPQKEPPACQFKTSPVLGLGGSDFGSHIHTVKTTDKLWFEMTSLTFPPSWTPSDNGTTK